MLHMNHAWILKGSLILQGMTEARPNSWQVDPDPCKWGRWHPFEQQGWLATERNCGHVQRTLCQHSEHLLVLWNILSNAFSPWKLPCPFSSWPWDEGLRSGPWSILLSPLLEGMCKWGIVGALAQKLMCGNKTPGCIWDDSRGSLESRLPRHGSSLLFPGRQGAHS